MAKRHADVICYVHHVSPQKKNKSFNVHLQTADSSPKLTRAICFDRKKFNILEAKSVSGEPVKIKNATIQDNKVADNYAPIVLTNTSHVSTVEPVQVTFPKVDPVYEYLKVNAVKDGNLVSVKGKIDLCDAVESTVLFGVKNRRVLNGATLTDSSGSINLSIWEEWIDYFREREDKCFAIRNLVVKEFEGSLQLTTNADTSVQPISEEELGPVQVQSKMPTRKEVKEFDCVREILFQLECLSCKQAIMAQNKEFLSCQSCESSVRTSKLRKKVMILVQISGLDQQFLLDAIDLKPFIKDLDPTSFDTDKDDLIGQIMNMKDFEVIIHDDQTSITIIPPEMQTEDESSNAQDKSTNCEEIMYVEFQKRGNPHITCSKMQNEDESLAEDDLLNYKV